MVVELCAGGWLGVLYVRCMIEFLILAAEHGASAGHSEHLEKKLAEKAELQITAAQNSRGETEVAPSAGKEVGEGSTGAHGSPRAGEDTSNAGSSLWCQGALMLHGWLQC